MTTIAWASRLTLVGASNTEVASIDAAFVTSVPANRRALDELIRGIDNSGLQTMLTNWRNNGGPFGSGFPSGGLPFGTHAAVLSGNPADDQFAIGAGTGATITVTPFASLGAAGSNLGAAQTIDFGNTGSRKWLSGILNANLTVTVLNRVAGASARLLVVQDGTGGHTVTISDGTNTTLVTVPSAAGTTAAVEIDCTDATNIVVSPVGVPGPAGPTGATGPTGPQGTTLGQSDYDAILPWTINMPFLPIAVDPAAKQGTWVVNTQSAAFYNCYIQNSPGNQNDFISVDLPMAEGTWDLTLMYAKAANEGIITFGLDGTQIGSGFDAYNAATTYNNVTLVVSGFNCPSNGKHRLSFTCASKNASSGAFQMTLEGFMLRRSA